MQKNFILAAALAAIFVIAPVAAQGPANAPPPTNVSGTILDPTGVPYNTGFIRFDLVPAGGPVPCVGTPCTSINGHYGNVYLDGNGHFQMNLYPNSLITPAATQWQITVSEPGNPAPWCFGPQSFTTAITVTNTSTMDVSATLSALAPQLCRNGGSSSSSIKIEHNGVLVGTEPAVNIVDTGTVVATVTDNPGLTRVDVSNAASSGTGCTIGTLLDQWVMFIHPNATCDGSIDWTWNDGASKQNMQAGVSNAAGFTDSYIFGNGNTATGLTTGFLAGDGNNLVSTDANVFVMGISNGGGQALNVNDCFIFGENNRFPGLGHPSTYGASVDDCGIFGEGNSLNFSNTGTTGGNPDDIWVVGKNNTITESGTQSVAIATVHIVGGSNTIEDTLNTVEFIDILGERNDINGAATTAQAVGWHNTLDNVSLGINTQVLGADNTLTGVATVTYAQVVGGNNTLSSCDACYIFGQNVHSSASNTAAFGMSATAGLTISNNGGSHDNVRLSPLAFASLPACAAGTEGSLMPVTDSTTATWGATITGGSTNHVLAYCDGTNWTVAAK